MLRKITIKFLQLIILLLFINLLSAETGGPDEGGYSWIDSTAPGPQLNFNWIDITSSGSNTGINTDDGWADVNIGFNFSFYGNTYNTIRVSANGYATFGTNGSDSSRDPIPNTNSPNDLLAVFW